MPFQLHAFSESEDEAGVYEGKTAVEDALVTTSGDIIYIPRGMNHLFGCYGAIGGTVEGSLYLTSPSLLRHGELDIQPTQEGISPSGAESVMIFPEHPIELDEFEGIECRVKSNPGSPEVHTVVIFLADGRMVPIPAGARIQTVRFTSAITETASTWKTGAITFRSTLPVGTYAVVGVSMWGTSGVAFRLNTPGAAHRPGFICHSSEGNKGHDLQRYGRLGEWQRFHSLTPPSIDWLAYATSGSSQAGVMDLIKLA